MHFCSLDTEIQPGDIQTFPLAVLAVRIVLILQGAETHKAELEIELSSTFQQSQH